MIDVVSYWSGRSSIAGSWLWLRRRVREGPVWYLLGLLIVIDLASLLVNYLIGGQWQWRTAIAFFLFVGAISLGLRFRARRQLDRSGSS